MDSQTIYPSGSISSARIEASKAGVEILKKGGNAFDAMIATELCLAVTYPYAGNIGGGGFLVYRDKKGERGALDYREIAPNKSYKNMYLDSHHKPIANLSVKGVLSIGVPGTISGIFEIYRTKASLPLDVLFRPAIYLANNGYVISKFQATMFNKYKKDFMEVNPKAMILNREWKEGDTFIQRELGATLKSILEKGEYEFYRGTIAKNLIDEINLRGGILSLEDMSEYKPKWRKPFEIKYKEYKIITMPLPSSGGVCLSQILYYLSKFELKKYDHNSTAYIQLIVEALKRAFADRSYYLGDMDFVRVPIDSILSKPYLDARFSNYIPSHNTPSDSLTIRDNVDKESTETTHYSILDSFGNAVSVTTTLNGPFGSKYYFESGGFFLNNEMDDFSIENKHPNYYGLIGSNANKIEPKKKMLSSMTPSIVEKNGNLYAIIGSPGGSSIISTVLQTFLNMTEYNMSISESNKQGRFHCQWKPEDIILEPNKFSDSTILQLQKMGYVVKSKETPVVGKMNGLQLHKKRKIEAAADPRGDEASWGY